MSKLLKKFKLKNTKKATSAVFAAALAVTAFVSNAVDFSNSDKYILQGASNSALISAIQAEQGEVIHEFKLIQAVSARLTPEQVESISSKNGMIRFANEGETAGIIWRPAAEEQTAGIIWRPATEDMTAGIIWRPAAEDQTA